MKIKIILAGLLCLQAFFFFGNLQARPCFSYYGHVFPVLAEPVYQFEIIPAPNNTWGYDIQKDNKLFIHQPNRPGLPGNEGFRPKKKAIKVAQLVIAKIKKGMMPPTISNEELLALKLAD